MKKVLTAIFICVLFNVAFSQDWEFAKEKNGITVYTREIEGFPIKEFKAIVTLDFSMDEVLSALTDFKSYTKWQYQCKESQLISKEDTNKLIYYMQISMPFPFDNRDVVCIINILRLESEIVLEVQQVEGVVDEREGVIRMPVSKGAWTITRIADNKTQLVQQFRGDPAGNIPSGIINLFLVDGPINSLTDLEIFLNELYR